MAISMIKLQTLNLKKLIRVSEVDVILFSLAFTFVFFTTRYQLNATREFYFWDNAGYHNIVLQMMDRLHSAPKLDFFRDLYHSFSDEISNLFAVPLLPFMELFGESRFIFILSMAFCYLLPTVFLTAWFCSRLVDSHRRLTFWVTTFLLLLSPFCWMSILDGRPDIGGSGLILLALSLQIFASSEKKNGEKKGRWAYPVIAFLLGISLLFRRHFMLVLPPYLLAAVFFEWMRLGFSPPGARTFSENKKEMLVRLFILGGSLGLFLCTLGYPFIAHYFNPKLYGIYASYKAESIRASGVVIGYFLSFFSIPLWILSLLGLRGLVRETQMELKNKLPIYWVMGFAILWVVTWINFGQARHNYIVTIFWIFPIGIVALVAWGLSAFSPENRSRITVTLLLVIGVVNALCLFNIGSFPKYFFPKSVVPLVRKDYPEIIRLIGDLQTMTGPKSPILVAGSSWILNEGVLSDAETQFVGRKNRRLNILGILHADSYKQIPIKAITVAEWAIVPTPFQWHIRPDVQQCIQVLHDAFMDHWEISQDFEMLPQEYLLNDGVIVKIFHRIKSTSPEVEQLTLVRMKNRILKTNIQNNT